MKHESPPTQLDVNSLARSASAISGSDLLSKYERLMQETQGRGGDNIVNWAARGELRFDQAQAEQVWLHLTVDTRLPLICQRCTDVVDVALAVHQSFRFVHSEAAAEAQDEDAEEDVLAMNPDFNLLELIEDEVLLALPLIARHKTCPVPVKLAVSDPDFEAAAFEKPNPFAVLAKLKDGKTG